MLSGPGFVVKKRIRVRREPFLQPLHAVRDDDELVVTPRAGELGSERGAARAHLALARPPLFVARDVQRGRGGREARHRRDPRDVLVAHERAEPAMPAPAQRLGNSLDPAAVAVQHRDRAGVEHEAQREGAGKRDGVASGRSRASRRARAPARNLRARARAHAAFAHPPRRFARTRFIPPARTCAFPRGLPRFASGEGEVSAIPERLNSAHARVSVETRGCRSVPGRARGCAALGARRHLRDPSAAGNLEN